jgi:hypothetical protein
LPSSVLYAVDCRAVLDQVASVVAGEAIIPIIASINEALSATMITKTEIDDIVTASTAGENATLQKAYSEYIA